MPPYKIMYKFGKIIEEAHTPYHENGLIIREDGKTWKLISVTYGESEIVYDFEEQK